MQRAFAPEDIGGEGYKSILNNDKSRAYQVTLGGKGAVGNWDYSLSFTRGEYRLDESKFQRFGNAINSYFADKVLGPAGHQDGIYITNWARSTRRSRRKISLASPVTPPTTAAPGRTWLARRSPTVRCSRCRVAMRAWPWSSKAAAGLAPTSACWTATWGLVGCRQRPSQQLCGDQRTAHAAAGVADGDRFRSL